jgi:hypothetical protein
MLMLLMLSIALCTNDLERLFNDTPPEKEKKTKLELRAYPESGSTITSLTQIELIFSAPVYGASSIQNYFLSGSGLGELAISEIRDLGNSHYSVLFTGEGVAGDLRMEIANLISDDDIALEDFVIYYTLNIDGPPIPTVTAYPPHNSSLTSISQVELEYNTLLSGVTFLDNYSISGDGAGTLSITGIQDLGNNRYLLSIAGFPKSGELRLNLNNLISPDDIPLSNPVIIYNLDIPGPTLTTIPADGVALNSLSTIDLYYSTVVLGADQTPNYVVSNATGGNLTPTGVNIININTNHYQLQLSGNIGNGTLTIDLVNITDQGLNPPNPSQLNFIADSLAPDIYSANPADGVVIPSITTWIISFSEAVSGADTPSNWTITGTGAGTLSASSVTQLGAPANTYEISLMGSPVDGGLTLTGVNIYDIAGNSFINSINITIDSVSPTISLAIPASGSMLNSLSQIDIQFSRAVTGADVLTNYVLSGPGQGTLARDSVSDQGGNLYRLTLTGASLEGAMQLQLNNIYDAINGLPLAGNTISYTFDLQEPTVTIDPPSGSLIGAIIQFDVTFNEAVLGAEGTNSYQFTGGAAGTLFVDYVTNNGGNNYTVVLGGASVTGILNITFSGITDLAGNALALTLPTYTIDAVAPTVIGNAVPPTVISTTPSNGTILNALTTIDIEYSDPVVNADVPGNYLLSGSAADFMTVSEVVNVSGNLYRLTLTGTLLTGTFTLNIINVEDIPGNPLDPSPLIPLTLTIDLEGPTVTAVPANGSYIKALPTIDLYYSEAVNGADVLGNYSLSSTAGKGTLVLDSVSPVSGNQYQLTLTGNPDNGVIELNISDTIEDDYANTLSTTLISYVGDIIVPTFTSTPTNSSLINSAINITIQYSEPMLGAGTPGNYSLSEVGKGTMTVTGVNNLGGNKYEVVTAGTPANGLVTLTLGGNITDNAGNALADNTIDYTADTILPDKTITPPANSAVGNGLDFFEITYTEPMGPTASLSGNYGISGTGWGNLAVSSVDNADPIYTVYLSGDSNTMQGGPVILILSANIQDEAGNNLSGPLTHLVMAGSDNYRTLTFNNLGISDGGGLTNFPVYVKLDTNRISYGGMQGAGQDLRFYDSDGSTALDYEIETWSYGGVSHVWVRIPLITNNSDTDFIYMYYGSLTLLAWPTPEATWNSNYRAVYHMSNDPIGGVIFDSTGNNNDATPENMDSGNLVPGQTGDGLLFNGADEYLWAPESSTLCLIQDINATFEVWFNWNSDGAPAFTPLLEKGHPTDVDNYSLYLSGFGPARLSFDFYDSNDSLRTYLEGSESFSAGVWNYTSLIFNDSGDYIRYLRNGAQTDTLSMNKSFKTQAVDILTIGMGNKFSVDYYFKGILDEIRIEAVAHSNAWETAQYRSMTDSYIDFGLEN